MASNQQLTKSREPRISTPEFLRQRSVGSQSNGGGGTSLLDFLSSTSTDRALCRSNKSINKSSNKSTNKKRKSNNNTKSNDAAKVQRNSMTLRNRNELKAPQRLEAADDNSILKALGGQRREGGVRRGSGQHRGSSEKKSKKKSGEMTVAYLIENLHSMSQKGTNGLWKANKDFGCATRCLGSKKSSNGSGFKACGCLGAKACNVTNLEDYIDYWNLPVDERALLGPPGSVGTYNPRCTDVAEHMRGMHSRGESGGFIGDTMKANNITGTVFFRTMNADVRDSNNNPLMRVVEATLTSDGKIILAQTQDGYDEDGNPYPNAPLAILHHLNKKVNDVGSYASLNSKAIHILESSLIDFGLQSHPDNANGDEGRGLGWEHLERVYTHPKLTKNVRKNQCCIEGVTRAAARALRKKAKEEKAKKEKAP